ncbi:hypothetical protein FACS1894103_2950 [Campylobacterota bacterium]|nr:hypothetical protein FACS1894103_2950 [Campylobacterota bacterium]
MNDGDILLYADIGCHLNPNGLKRLDEYFEMANSSPNGLLAFQSDHLLEKTWTKGDLFDYFSVRNSENIYNTGQIAATTLFVKKCAPALTIIESWQKIFYDHWILVDDTPSHSPNFEGFRDHRHDQSVFSILAKLNQVPTLSGCEIWAEDFNDLSDKPILAKRDKHFKVGVALFIKQRIQRRYKRTAEKIRKFIKRMSRTNQ